MLLAGGTPVVRDTYQFGDTLLAAQRLRRLAEVFEPSSREFLGSLAGLKPRGVVDLGCGPGFTTRLAARVFPSAEVLGLDSSTRFIALARRARPAARRAETALRV